MYCTFSKYLISRKFLIPLALILFSFSSLMSQVSASFNDTAIQRGNINQIPIYGTVSGTAVTDIKLVFSFDSRIIDVKGGLGGDKYAMKSKETVFSLSFPKLDSAVFEISSNEIQNISNGIICMVKVEGLVFSDSLAKLTLEAIYVNGTPVSDFVPYSGIIKVLGESYLAHLPDYLGQCIPNPFVGKAKFDFSLENSSKVKFFIYTALGRLVMTSDENEFSIFTAKSLEKTLDITDFSSVIGRGNYSLTFSPIPWEFAQGLYFLIMQTDKGTYKTNFLYFKQ